MVEQLHEIVGYLSAVAYFICSIVALITFLLLHLIPFTLLAYAHLIFVILAFTSTIGLLYWWICEARNPFAQNNRFK